MLNPTRQRLLETFSLDKEIVEASGCTFTDKKGEKYIDFLSQYASLPFGHNPQNMWNAIDEFRATGMPVMVQPLRPLEAENLAGKLEDITGFDHTILANSGAEAVEAAIKVARSRTGKDVILSTYQSFHGKTLGALSATGNNAYQKDFGLPVENFEYIPYNDLIQLENYLKWNEVAAFIVEPIQGEGGIVCPDKDYIKSAIEICKKYGVVSIVDEIQTGMGRTGSLFASDLSSDILLLGKALGGGILPISAIMIKDDIWDDKFGLYHSSTFANNNLISFVAGRSIDEVQKVTLLDLRSQLEDIAERYPSIIKEIRGKGYMCGVEFYPIFENSAFMSFNSLNGGFIVVISSYLLNIHKILTAPAFNNTQVLRVQPPLTITQEEVDHLLKGLEDVCEILLNENYYKLIEHQRKPDHEVKVRENGPSRHVREKERGRFCFLIHYTQESDIRKSDPSFTETHHYKEWVKHIGPGFAWSIPTITSKTGDTADGMLMSLPLLPEDMVGGNHMVEEAIDLAQDFGAKRFGLGAFTSVITRGGKSVQNRSIPLTSGTLLTTVSAVEKVKELSPKDSTVAVIGTHGSIGSLATKLLKEHYKVIPVGRRDDLEEKIQDANVIFVATNAVSSLIDPSKLKSGTIVFDVSIPYNVVGKPADGVQVFESGLVEPPSELNLGPFQVLPKNLSWGCLGETMLLALEDSDEDFGRNLTIEDAKYIGDIAKKHGFIPKVRKSKW